MHDGVQVIKALMHTGTVSREQGIGNTRRITAVRFTQQIN